jgi:hypothetical protein
MRHIFHEILSRYLDSEQFAFDASPRELWSATSATWHPQASVRAGGQAPERARRQRVYRELESQR